MSRQPEPQARSREEQRQDVGPFCAAGQTHDTHQAQDAGDRAFQQRLGAEEAEYAEHGIGGQQPGGDPDVPGNDGAGFALIKQAPRAREMIRARLAFALGKFPCQVLM